MLFIANLISTLSNYVKKLAIPYLMTQEGVTIVMWLYTYIIVIA